MKRKIVAGFTLIEVLVVVAIIAILAAIAVPNYTRYTQRARRAEARDLLMRIAAAQERYYTNFNSYAASVTGAPPAGLGFGNALSEQGFYRAAIVLGPNSQTYTLSAAPVAGTPQAVDKCATLTLTGAGVKSTIGGNESNGKCW